jgi:hypothetical protein
MNNGSVAITTSLTRNQKFAAAVFCLWFLLPLIVTLLGELFFYGTALTNNLHIGLYISVTILWASVTALLWQFLPDDRKLKLTGEQKRRPFGIVSAVVIYLFLILPYFCRRMIEILAFSTLNTPVTEAYLSISYATGRHSWNYSLVGPIFERQGREVSIKVNEALRWRYGQVSTHYTDCIRVSVQSGRQGFERIIGPDRFDDGITENRIVENCNASTSH